MKLNQSHSIIFISSGNFAPPIISRKLEPSESRTHFPETVSQIKRKIQGKFRLQFASFHQCILNLAGN